LDKNRKLLTNYRQLKELKVVSTEITKKLLNEKDTSWLDYWAIIFWQGLLE